MPQFDEIGFDQRRFGSPERRRQARPGLKRDKNWTYELTAQHELFPRVRVFGGYYRRRYFDLAYTNNLATANWNGPADPGDWGAFSYIGPVDPRLQDGGGEDIAVYNLAPLKIPAVNTPDRLKTNAPDDYRTYNGLEIGTNVQLPKNAFAMTSLTAGKTHVFECTVDNPNSLRFCNRTTPFRYIFKVAGGFALPWSVQVAANFQIYDTPGAGLFLAPPYYAANQTVNAGILGRPFTGGTDATGNSMTLNLLAPNTIFAPYYKIFDLRLSKLMTVGRNRITALAEFDNLFNMRNTVAVTENWGNNWLVPATVQRGLNVRFGVQYPVVSLTAVCWG